MKRLLSVLAFAGLVSLMAGCEPATEDPTVCPDDKTVCGSLCCENETQKCVDGACVDKNPDTNCVEGQTACGSGCCDDATQTCVNEACVAKGEEPDCTEAQTACGTVCCDDATQTCVNEVCVAKGEEPDCTEAQTACGTVCCDNATENCVIDACISKNHCDPGCSGQTPDCLDGVCKCNETSCGEGKLCNESGVCVNTCHPACSGTTPDCEGTTCKCNETSCGEHAACVDGACVPVCDPECEGTTPQCATGGVCQCTATSCGEEFNCYEGTCVEKVCEPACDPLSSTPVCVLDACKCTPYSCDLGEACVDGACVASVCAPACTGDEVCDSSGEENACVLPGETCGVTIPLALGVPANGTTAGASNMAGSLSATCSSELGWFIVKNVDGPDLTYRYTPATDGKFGVKVSSSDLALWRMDGACGEPSTCAALVQDEWGDVGQLLMTVDGVAQETYFFVVDSPSGTDGTAFTIEIVSPCDPLAAEPCATGNSCRYNGTFYECSADGSKSELETCRSGSECGAGLDCSTPEYSGGTGLCYRPCPIDTPECLHGTCVAFGADDDNFGLCAACPTDCGGTTPICKRGVCVCDETSCGSGFVCESSACVESCNPTVVPATCAAETACVATHTPGNFVCKAPGVRPAGYSGCGGPGTCVAEFECDAWEFCSAYCALDGSLPCAAGERCDSYNDDAAVGTCRPCPATKVCGSACCANDQICDQTSTCVAAPAISNDKCEDTPTVLTKGVAVSGVTALATDDYPGADWADLSSTCTGRFAGKDLVYSYTPAAAGDFTITVTPDSRYQAQVWYSKGTCGGSACLSSSLGTAKGTAVTLTVAGAEAGETYFIVVDGKSSSPATSASTIASSSGTFSIQVD
jgi:hypothetical protein